MSEQGDLFAPRMTEGVRSPVATADPETSHVAARALRASGIMARQCGDALERLRDWYADRGYAPTSAELAQGDTDARFRLARRLPELEQMGHVRRGAPRPCAVTGRMAVTWDLT